MTEKEEVNPKNKPSVQHKTKKMKNERDVTQRKKECEKEQREEGDSNSTVDEKDNNEPRKSNKIIRNDQSKTVVKQIYSKVDQGKI